MDMKLVKDNNRTIKIFEDAFGVSQQELLDAGADQSFLMLLWQMKTHMMKMKQEKNLKE